MDGAPRTRSSLDTPAELRAASETARSSLVLAAASSSTSVTPGAPGTPAVLARALSHQASRSSQPGFDPYAGSSGSSRLSRQGSNAGSSMGWPPATGIGAGGGPGASRASMDRGVGWWESRAGSTSIATSTPEASIRPLGLAAFPPPSPVGPVPGPPVTALGTWGTASLGGSPTEAAAAAAAAGGSFHGEGALLSPHHRPSSPSGLLTRHSVMARASLSGVGLPLSPSYNGRASLSAEWGPRKPSPEPSAFGSFVGTGELREGTAGTRLPLHSSLSAGHR